MQILFDKDLSLEKKGFYLILKELSKNNHLFISLKYLRDNFLNIDFKTMITFLDILRQKKYIEIVFKQKQENDNLYSINFLE